MKTGLRRVSGDAIRLLAAVLAAAVVSALLVLLGASATSAGMIFLALVVWFASQAGIWLSLLVTLLYALLFDFFFLPPLHSLQIVGSQHWVALVTFLASCLVVSRVAELARKQAVNAEQRRADVERLYALSQEMMFYEDADRIIYELPRLIERIFSLSGVVLYVCERDQFYASTPELPMSIRDGLRTMIQGPNLTLDLPGGVTAMALVLGLRPVGALGWKQTVLSREVASAMSAQVAIVIARSIAIEASTRMEAAREGERLRTALTDSLTHELRTPLTSIRAAATTLLQAEGLDEAGQRDMAAIIDEESARLDLLIGEAVEMAEIDANVVQVHPVPQHPRALLDQAVEESRKNLALHRVRITVENEGQEDKPAWFDPSLLGRVLRHLLENAAAHTPAGSTVTLSSRREDDRLEFRVEDNGPGIDSHDLPLIFEKFYRGKRRTTKGKGSGMGLAITRAILAAHGGGIEATSVSGKGACFRFWVPLVEKEPNSTQ